MANTVQQLVEANEIDFAGRLDACRETPLVNPLRLPLRIERDNQIFVVRDDFLCGGTKSRVSYDFLKSHSEYQEYVYVSPWYGGAQIALPWLLRLLDLENPLPTGPRKAVIVIDQYPLGIRELYPREESELVRRASQWRLPPFGLIGESYGATFIEVPSNEEKFRVAEEYARGHHALFLKPGFDYPEVLEKIAQYARAIKEQYGEFDEAWVATGSGTMIRGLQRGEIAKRYYAVCIFKSCPDVGQAEPIPHDQGHNDPVPLEERPPYPSSLRYDAKTWKYVRGRPGKILVWNVM